MAQLWGDVPHVSPLLRRAMHRSGCAADHVGEWLLKCAVTRGASHYARDFDNNLPPDDPRLSDEEIGVALCLGEHLYNSTYLRAAAQLLSSPRIQPKRLAHLAVMERVEPALIWIARAAERIAPEAQPWRYLRKHLTQRTHRSSGALPHWSRFVSQTGVTPDRGNSDIRWLFRREPKVEQRATPFRTDDDDLRDIRFLLEREPLGREQLECAFAHARVPDVPEILDLFVRAQPKVIEMAAHRS